MEKIISIKEYSEKGFEGFEVLTDKQQIRMKISSGQSCCEQFGYFSCNDDVNDFVGANLLDVRLVDQALSTVEMTNEGINVNDKYFEGGLMFVNLETDRGTLQFVLYNMHNGYYSHEARVESTQLNCQEFL